MGRRDAVTVQLEVAQAVLAIEPRMVITWEPGWESRGNGTSANFEGGIVHHTAFISSERNPNPARNTLIKGRPDLSGPLCNWTGPWCTVEQPRLHVIAANPANHAGASGGRSMGPLPVTSLFNPRVLGLEVDYAGLTPMTNGQYHAAKVWSLAVSRVLDRPSLEWIRAHAETSVTGKWDIGYANGRTYDMAAFRRDAAQVSGGPVAFQEDPDMRIIQQRERGIAVVGPGYYKGLSPDQLYAAGAMYGAPVIFDNAVDWDRAVSVATGGESILDAPIQRNEEAGGGTTTLRAQTHWADYNFRTVVPEAVAKVVGTPQIDAEAFASQVAEALAGKVGLSREDVKSAMGEVLIQGAGTTA